MNFRLLLSLLFVFVAAAGFNVVSSSSCPKGRGARIKLIKSKLEKELSSNSDLDGSYLSKYMDYISNFDKSDFLCQDLSVLGERYSYFVETDKRVSSSNKTLGHTSFSDLSSEEKSMYVMSPESYQSYLDKDYYTSSCTYQTPPSSWASSLTQNYGYCQPIQNQEQCGDCWNFASVAQFEFNYRVQENRAEKFSEQYVLDCSNCGSCDGGYPEEVSNFFVDYGACPSTGYANYSESTGSCSGCRDSTVRASYSNCLSSGGESNYYLDQFQSAMKVASYDVAMTLNMGIDDSFYNVGSSSPYYTSCSTITGYHSMAIIGSDITSSDGSSGWLLVRNSWGTYWGSNGYFWLSSSAAESCQFGYLTWNSWEGTPW